MRVRHLWGGSEKRGSGRARIVTRRDCSAVSLPISTTAEHAVFCSEKVQSDAHVFSHPCTCYLPGNQIMPDALCGLK